MNRDRGKPEEILSHQGGLFGRNQGDVKAWTGFLPHQTGTTMGLVGESACGKRR
jgi:ABC-type glutathione transport system ATPase component